MKTPIFSSEDSNLHERRLQSSSLESALSRRENRTLENQVFRKEVK